jgi:ABC-type sulfate/molybdate transport systems ATPase subunit
LLLLDEPLASLDVHGRRDMRALLREWLSRAQIPAILVTHDPDDVRARSPIASP